jgi:hypothetical protein
MLLKCARQIVMISKLARSRAALFTSHLCVFRPHRHQRFGDMAAMWSRTHKLLQVTRRSGSGVFPPPVFKLHWLSHKFPQPQQSRITTAYGVHRTCPPFTGPSYACCYRLSLNCFVVPNSYSITWFYCAPLGISRCYLGSPTWLQSNCLLSPCAIGPFKMRRTHHQVFALS